MWNGMFSPDIRKTIGTVRFVPLHEMGDKDWAILEYPNLRDKAKNRIADQIVAGELLGFFHVNILEKRKAKAKHDYYWPANRKSVKDFEDADEGKEARFFRNEPDDDIITDNAAYVDNLMDQFSNPVFYPPSMLRGLLRLALRAASPAVLAAHTYHERLERELEQELQGTDERVPYETYLLLIIFVLAVYGREKLDEVLEQIEEQYG